MADGLGSKIGSAFIEVGTSFIGFGQNLAADVTNSFMAQSYIVGNALEKFGQAVFTRFSLPLLAATGANIAQFQALDREIRTVLTLFGTAPTLINETIGEMAAGIREVSIEVGGLERDIGEGLYQAISAGVPRGGVFDFLEVAQMAAIADRTADVTTAVDGLTTVINAWSLEASDAARVSDVMFQTVAAGKTTFGELSADIGRVAPLASSAGVAFEELFAIIGTLTLQGLKTSEAISFMRAAITGLLRPTDELNEVFREAGHSSAEAAVPVIGLQAAFDTVFQAVGGSTSKMQELIGTSEGVSAILGVTGENADKFGRVMGGVEDSVGASSRAFEIMDQGVGRTFGKMTEAFDRLGNTFGEMSSKFAVPVLETATGVLNRMVDVFTKLRPIVGGLATGFGAVMKVFELPVLREIVSIFAVMGTTIFGLIGGLGLFALTFGKVLLAGLKIKTIATLLTGLNSVLAVTRLGIQGMGTSMLATSAAMQKGGVMASFAARPVALLGKAFVSTRFATLAAAGAFTGILVAITAVVAVVGHLITKHKEAIAAQDTFGKQTDKLAESLGLLNLEMSLPGAEEGQNSITEFMSQNSELLRTLEKTRNALGEIAAQELLESIAVQLIFKGNSPEEVLEHMEMISDLTGIKIDLDASDLEDATVLMEEFAEGVMVTGQMIGEQGTFGSITGAVEATAEGILELWKLAAETGDAQGFIDSMNRIIEGMELTEYQASQLGAAIDAAFAGEFEGVDMTRFWQEIFDPNELQGLLDPEELLSRLSAEGIEIPVGIRWDTGRRPPPDLQGTEQELDTDAIEEQIEARREQAEELGISLQTVYSLVRGSGVEAFEEFAEGISGAFETAREEVQDAFDEIASGIESQNPLLDVYTGKIEQSFSEWREGQQQFREDLESVTELRERLVGDKSIPQEFVEAFDKQPISKQAWLAGLGEKNLQSALEELTSTQNLIDETTTERITQSFTGIMEEARGAISEQYGEMRNDAAEAGPDVAKAFDEKFGIEAQSWATTAQTWWDQLNGILSKEIPGPRVGPLQLPGGVGGIAPNTSGGNTYNTTVNNPTTTNLSRDLDRARHIQETSSLPVQ